MSGFTQRESNDRLRRYQEMVQRTNNTSFAPSSIGSLCESRVLGHSLNSTTLQRSNGTLSTQQFYQQGFNSNPNQFQKENVPPKPPSVAASSVSEAAAVFKVPQPVRQIDTWSRFKIRIDFMMSELRQLENKKHLRLAVRLIELVVHSIRYPSHQPATTEMLINNILRGIQEQYCAGKIPESVCGTASIISDLTSNFDPWQRAPLDNTNSSTVLSLGRSHQLTAGELEILTSRLRSNETIRPTVHERPFDHYSTNTALDHMGRPTSSNQQPELNLTNNPTNKRRRPAHSDQQLYETTIENESSLHLFNDSIIAQRRDELAVKQISEISQKGKICQKPYKNTRVKSTPKPKLAKPRDVRKSDELLVRSDASREGNSKSRVESTVSPTEGVTGVSRRGRLIKAPVQYWNHNGSDTGKNGTINYREDIEPNLNESMTLRNNKVVEKKKTPPLATISEKRNVKAAVNKQQSKKHADEEKKENLVGKKKKPAKEQTNHTSASKETSSKGKSTKNNSNSSKENSLKIVVNNKKEESSSLNEEKQEKKKAAPKRKSKESCNKISKKKKIEVNEPAGNTSIEVEDDLFGEKMYKKITQHVSQAFSPSSGMLSAKKAAGAALGKMTPPCKALGELMNVSIRSGMSSVKEAPIGKRDEAVKRVIKKMEKDQIKPPSKQQKDKKQTNQSNVLIQKMMDDAVKSTYSTATPLSSATLTVFRGHEPESEDDYSGSDLEDNDEDLM